MNAADRAGSVFAAARSNDDVVVLEGFHAVKHCLRFGGEPRDLVTDDIANLTALATLQAPDLLDAIMSMTTTISNELMRKLVPRAPASRLLAIADIVRPSLQRLFETSDRPVVLLDDPRAANNLGAVIRVAAATGVAAVATIGSIDPWSSAAVRASAGLHYALPVAHLTAIDIPRSSAVIGFDTDGELMPIGAALPPRAVLAFGNERHGLSNLMMERADQRWRLPMRVGVSSLNLATSVAAVLYRSDLLGGIPISATS